MSNKQPLEVLPHGEEWAVQRQKAERALKTFDTKSEATDYARDMAKSEKGALFIKNTAGEVLESRNYGD